MNVKKISFPLHEVVGDKGLLIAVADVFDYKDGKRTEKVIGTRYDVLLLERKYEPLSIKMLDKPIITAKELEKLEEPPTVYFQGVYGKVYCVNNQVKMSVTAENISLIGGVDDEI